jgi:hypothetical protein
MRKKLAGLKNESSYIFVFLALLSLVLFGCREQTESSAPSQKQATNAFTRPRIVRTAQLAEMVPIGTSTNDIMVRLGPPDWIRTNQHVIEWRYYLDPFPADDAMKGTKVVGATIWITNGRVAFSDFAYDGTKVHTSKPVHRKISQVGTNALPLKFFVVENDKVSAQPDLIFNEVKYITVDEFYDLGTNYPSECEITIALHQKDALQFSNITRINIGKQMVIMVGDETIAKPVISTAIENGVLNLQLTKRAAIEQAGRQFSRVQQK